MTAMISPGIVGMYWLLGSLIAAAVWSTAAHLGKRAARHAGARRCGMCSR